jgi:hypothetical protein
MLMLMRLGAMAAAAARNPPPAWRRLPTRPLRVGRSAARRLTAKLTAKPDDNRGSRRMTLDDYIRFSCADAVGGDRWSSLRERRSVERPAIVSAGNARAAVEPA